MAFNLADMVNISTHSLTRRLTEEDHETTQLLEISTHSLTRRLTKAIASSCKALCISTHSLTRRLTFLNIFSISLSKFQLTASQGG